jgi:hypothetical protein
MKVIEECFTTANQGLKPKAFLVQHCCDWKRYLTGNGDYEDPENLVEETQEPVDIFQAAPLFQDISNITFHHQFKISRVNGKVVVQARPNVKPAGLWEPKEGCEVLLRLPDQECPFIIQPKPLKDDDMAALRAVRRTFEKTNHIAYKTDAEVKEFWENEEQYQEKLRKGQQPTTSAPQDFYKVLHRHDSYGKFNDVKQLLWQDWIGNFQNLSTHYELVLKYLFTFTSTYP